MSKKRYKLNAARILASDEGNSKIVTVRYNNTVVQILSVFRSEEDGEQAVIMWEGKPLRVPIEEVEDV